MQKDSDETFTAKQLKKTCRKKLCKGFFVGVLFVIIGFIILDTILLPLTSSNDFCVSCHSMKDAHKSWKESTHYSNETGMRADCVSCHLPPAKNYTSHVTAKACTGIRDACVHFLGKYDAEKTRQHAKDKLPNKNCMSCHNDLLERPASNAAVAAVHEQAIGKKAKRAGYTCVTCHTLHGEKADEPAKEAEYEAENMFCTLCHLNFDGEEFVSVHQKADVGCVNCHGESDQHSADEAHIIPPDIMFKKEDVNNSCFKDGCHIKEEIDALPSHSPFVSGKDKTNKYCTDCHGNHGIPERHRVWDKDTKKLIEADGEPYESDINPGGGAKVYDSGMGM